MRHSSSPVCSLARLCGSAAVIALLASGLGGCKTTGSPEVTGALGAQAALPPEAESHRAIEAMGDRYRANPRDAEAALRYGNALRQNGQRQQAVAVL